jgi:hypothetical protein
MKYIPLYETYVRTECSPLTEVLASSANAVGNNKNGQ